MPKMEINFTEATTGQGKLTFKGKTYDCLGKAGFQYPKDCTIDPSDKSEVHHSEEYDIDLPWAILLVGQSGIYIHQDVSGNFDDEEQNSHGCINLRTGDAEEVYNAFTEKTRVVISYQWAQENQGKNENEPDENEEEENND